MAGLCEGGNEPPGSLKAFCDMDGICESNADRWAILPQPEHSKVPSLDEYPVGVQIQAVQLDNAAIGLHER
ncbi:hypothetical protein ANN_06296, partial [Periplaneta americana]